jgi:hypothetical protein
VLSGDDLSIFGHLQYRNGQAVVSSNLYHYSVVIAKTLCIPIYKIEWFCRQAGFLVETNSLTKTDAQALHSPVNTGQAPAPTHMAY